MNLTQLHTQITSKFGGCSLQHKPSQHRELSVNQRVAGSSPAEGAKAIRNDGFFVYHLTDCSEN
jgi:hypothetical protein